MNKIIALILISSQAFAGLPPPTILGQSDSTAKTKFQIQVPHNQVTDLGGVKALIETGNGNIFPDPGFEASVSGWTASGGATATANSTAKGTGAKGYDWDSNSAAQTLQSQSVTIPAGLQGKNGIASCNIKTVSGTATHTFTVNDGTTDIVTPITIQSSTTAFLGPNEGNKINFVFPTGGTIRIKLAAVNANEPEIYIDDCAIKLADNVYDAPLVTPWVSFSGVYSAGFGTVTNNSCFKRRVGSNLEVKCAGTTGTVAASTGSIDIPDSLVLDTTKNPVVGSFGNSVGIFYQDGGANRNGTMSTLPLTSTTKVYVGPRSSDTALLSPQTMSSMYGSSATFSLNFSVPISGWSAVSAVSADQTDYDWTSYTPTFTGFGTVTGVEFQHSRVGSNLLVRGKWTNGTVTATEARVSLPSGLTSADTTKIPSIQNVSFLASNVSGSFDSTYGVLIEPSVSYFTFGKYTSSSSILTKADGTVMVTGRQFSFSATIPIQGWSSNQRAPTLVGSVTSNSASALRSEYVKFGTTSSSVCSASPCAYTRSSSAWFTNVTRSSTGFYTVNVPSGTFSDIPVCTCTVGAAGNAAKQCSLNDRESLTAIPIVTSNGSGSVADAEVSVTCIGPR